MPQPPVSWRSRLKRWRWWIAAIALIILVRALLPVALRRVVASQASEALHARVDVGDVDRGLGSNGCARTMRTYPDAFKVRIFTTGNRR